jgi:hypothetical protein
VDINKERNGRRRRTKDRKKMSERKKEIRKR